MSVIDTLITNRALSDVQLWRSLRNQVNMGTASPAMVAFFALGTMRGAYNAWDMNRVGEAVNYIGARLAAVGYSINWTAKTDWTDEDIPTPAQLADYLAHVRTVRGILTVYTTTPQVPEDMELLTYTEANDIERILADVDDLITKMIAAFRHSGATVSGFERSVIL